MNGLGALQNYVTGGEVTQAYRDILGRAPDTGGLQFYTNPNLSLADLKAQSISFDLPALITGGGKTVNEIEKTLSKPQVLSVINTLYTVVCGGVASGFIILASERKVAGLHK